MKYKIGDKVKVINYGSLLWQRNSVGNISILDIRPGVIGKEGVICKADLTQGKPTYAIDGIPEKHSWYDEEQLEMVTSNTNQ